MYGAVIYAKHHGTDQRWDTGVDKIMAVDKAELRQNIFNRDDLNAALHQF